MAEIFTILTQVGMREIAKAIESGNKIKFAHLAVGDGNGSLPEINDEMTSLVNEVWRGQVDGVTVGENKNEWVMLTAYIPASEGGFEIREIGAYDEKGQLLAVGTYPVIWKPSEFDGAVTELTIRMAIGISNTEAVELYFDDSAQYVTMSELKDVIDANIQNKADKEDLKGLAKESYVDEKISEIKDVDLSVVKNDILRLEENKADMSEVEAELSLKADQTEFEALQDKSLTFDIFSQGVITRYTYSFDIEGKGVVFLVGGLGGPAIRNLEIDGKSIGDVLKNAKGDVQIEGIPFFLPFYESAKGNSSINGVKVLLI